MSHGPPDALRGVDRRCPSGRFGMREKDRTFSSTSEVSFFALDELRHLGVKFLPQ